MPVVVPVLLHHGGSAWQAAPELLSMVDGPAALLEATRPFMPHFRFLLDDLGATSTTALGTRALHALVRLVKLALWSSRSMARLREAAPLMKAVLEELAARDDRTRSLLEQLFLYVLRATPPDVEIEEVRTILLEVAGLRGREDVMNAAEQLIEQGREQGRVQGELSALRASITAVLSARGWLLSEVGRARLDACSDADTLARWHRRAVTAASESDVFAGDDA